MDPYKICPDLPASKSNYSHGSQPYLANLTSTHLFCLWLLEEPAPVLYFLSMLFQQSDWMLNITPPMSPCATFSRAIIEMDVSRPRATFETTNVAPTHK